MSRRHLALGLAGALLTGYVLFTSFRNGWTRVETDFPNYYTAAVLTIRHQPLRSFYEWTWFQRQMNYTGTERQLGGYIPHTPLTMLPLLPLAGLPPQQAKHVWLILGLLCLAASVWILSRLSKLHPATVLILALLAWAALRENLVLGQYYLFLLFLLTLAAGCMIRGRQLAGGALIGLIFALKLYTAPFLFYFAVRCRWKALGGMLASVGILTLTAIIIFGFDGVWYFVTTVLLRGVDGSINDPYNPGWGSMTAFLRRTFVPEPELNPHPLIAAPPVFFFIRTLYTLGVLGVSLLVLARDSWDEGRAFACFVIVLFALSPNTASYHFILLLVAVALLMRGASPMWSAGLILLYGLVQLPLYSWDERFFPRAWLLLAMFLYAGWAGLRSLRRQMVAATLAAVIAVSAADAWRRLRAYGAESTRVAARAVIDPDNIYSSRPAAAGDELVYETIADDRYLLRVSRGVAQRNLAFDGQALHPALAQPGGPIYFELVSKGHSRICSFEQAVNQLDVIAAPDLNPTEPAISADGRKLAFVSAGALYVRENGINTRIAVPGSVSDPAFFPDGGRIAFAAGPPGERELMAVSTARGDLQKLTQGGDSFQPVISPDGRLLAYVVSGTGERQVWIRDLASGHRRQLTSGACQNDSPAWRGNSAFLFATDCDRGLGLPALYTLPVTLP